MPPTISVSSWCPGTDSCESSDMKRSRHEDSGRESSFVHREVQASRPIDARGCGCLLPDQVRGARQRTNGAADARECGRLPGPGHSRRAAAPAAAALQRPRPGPRNVWSRIELARSLTARDPMPPPAKSCWTSSRPTRVISMSIWPWAASKPRAVTSIVSCGTTRLRSTRCGCPARRRGDTKCGASWRVT